MRVGVAAVSKRDLSYEVFTIVYSVACTAVFAVTTAAMIRSTWREMQYHKSLQR